MVLENVREDVVRFLDEYRRAEGERYSERVPGSRAASYARIGRVLLSQYGLHALMTYRLGRWLRSDRHARLGRVASVALRPVHAMAARYVRAAYDIRLDESAEIGPGLFIAHVGDIDVSGCRIGAGCSIHHRVHIGPEMPGSTGPIIGDEVWIGPHATVLGAVHVGDRATVATGTTVLRDVPSGAVVLGDPARIVPGPVDTSPAFAVRSGRAE